MSDSFRHHFDVANYLDFLLVLDDYIRSRPDGCVRQGHEMHEVAWRAGLAEQGHEVAANWAGILVEHEYLSHGPLSMGDRRVEVPGRVWDSTQVQRYTDYRLTSSGREEADRVRRQAREGRTDAALGGAFPQLVPTWLGEGQRGAIAEPIRALQAALDADRHGEAIGAAKDLVEAACKICIERAGLQIAANLSLPALFKQACAAIGDGSSVGDDLGRSLTATVQRLAELRNTAGAGHGRASVPNRAAPDSYLAASAACGVTAFLFGAAEAHAFSA